MNVYRDISEVKRNVNTAITVGTFDGVHLVHRQILNKVLVLSKQNNLRCFVVTFEPHPQEVLKTKTPDIKLLTSIDEKLRLLEKCGIENVLVIRFTEQFSKTEPREFYKKYVFGQIGLCDLIIGYDHLFGRDRGGDFNTLLDLGKEFGFKVHRVEEIDVDGRPVSATRIRKALAEGKIEEANKLLGYEYSFDGIVVEGDKVGRAIGYPTVNLKFAKENKVMPNDGIYCVKVVYNNDVYYGMMYHGVRPTLTQGLKSALEVHIFDFDKTIYGEKLTISFLTKLRDDRKFNSKEELIEQINKDKENSLKFLSIKLKL
ncbi:MAG: bifunctional riboflavin kinase/FAD synthetase [Chlorobi bacterium]|nr:bifunctional riboflavin kinase/FAD synthetase [Chlorobiota bacterium]MCI0716519.1 bifunctional riboflavin kinase/FAD synthetase [Chlorobiota bacterium]